MSENGQDKGVVESIRDEARERLLPQADARQMKSRLLAKMGIKPVEPTKIDEYTYLGTIGSGGMGTVFACYDPHLDRKVAVKVLRGERGWSARTKREGQALARLRHPNVVLVYKTGEYEGRPYLAMEYVEGPTLKEWVDGQDRTWREILTKYTEAGRGLAAAHRANVIHRDFKPANVLVGLDGAVRVLDFGLARGRDAAKTEPTDGSRDPAASGSLLYSDTRTGALRGTIPYMSPEQHRGEDVDPRTDQFSYCVAFYEALYGGRPFAGNTQDEIIAAIEAGEIPPAPADTQVPNWVRRVLLRGLAIDRNARYESMDALLEDLGRDPARLLKRSAIVVGVLAIVVTGGLAWQANEQQHEAERARQQSAFRAEEAEKEKLEIELRQRRDSLILDEVEPALDRDPTEAIGRLQDLESFEDWQNEARMLAADADHRGVASRVIELPAAAVPHGLSPDGRTAITRNPESQEMSLFDIGTEELYWLGATGGMPEAAFSPDGTRIAALRVPTGLRVWEGEGDNWTPTSLGDSPDDHHAIIVSDTAGVLTFGRHPDLHRWRNGQRQVLDGKNEIKSVAVHPAGTYVATADDLGQARLWDLATGETTPLSGTGPVAFAPSGRLAIGTSGGDIDVLDLETDEAVRYVGRESGIKALVFAPGAAQLAVGFDDGGISTWDLDTRDRHDLPPTEDEIDSLRYVNDEMLGATGSTALTLHRLGGGQPRVFRGHNGVGWWAVRDDGDLVTVGREKTIRVWALEDAAQRDLTAHEGPVGVVAFVPDGTLLTGGDDGTVRRWTETDAGKLVADHEDEPITTLAVSPDGRYVASADQAGHVLLGPPGASGSTVLVDLGDAVQALAWSADSSRLAIARPDGGVVVFAPGNDEPTGRIASELQMHAVHVSGDGDRILAVGWSPSDEGDYLVWLRMDGSEDMRVQFDTSRILAAAFSGDGQYAAYSNSSREIRVFAIDDKRELILGQHDQLVDGITFGDAATVAAAGRDGVVKLWDIVSGYSRAVELSRRPLHAVAFRPDRREFVAVGDATTAFYGRDDLPRDAQELRTWVAARTDLEVELAPKRRGLGGPRR